MPFIDELLSKQKKIPSIPECKIKNNIQQGFSLVELIVVVAIIGTLAVSVYLGIGSVKRSLMNDKMLSDIISISNALDSYARAHNGKYPIPEVGKNMNVQCFAADASYFHDCEKASFIQGAIDNSLLGVKYLQEVPTDPSTGSRYAYGVSNNGKFFQVAGVWDNGGSYEARTSGNINKSFNLPSLIRSYNSPNFVTDKNEHLPYNPDHLILKATLQNMIGMVEIDDEPALQGSDVTEGQTITTGNNSSVDLYFTDGSVSHLDSNSELVLKNLKVEENNNKNIISKVKLLLSKGKLWNKVVRLSEKSEFNVKTSQAIAGVRGTEFKVDVDNKEIAVRSGRVAILDKDDPTHEIAEISDNGNDISLSNPIIATVRNGTANIVDGDLSIKQDYDKAFPKYLNNMIIPYLIKADSEILTIETVDYQVDKIFSTLNGSPLSFTKDDYYRVAYNPSNKPQRFYFEDNIGNRSGMTFETTLNNVSEEVGFEGISTSFSKSYEARWSLSEPPDKLVYKGKNNSFSLSVRVLNKNSLLEPDQLLTYKLIIYTPAICKNTSPEFFNGFSFDGEFEIEALGEGECIYSIEAGVPNDDSWPESLVTSFGMSDVIKLPIEERHVEDLYADFQIKTESCDSEEGTIFKDSDSFTMFEDQTFHLCGPDIVGEPEDTGYYWSSDMGYVENSEIKNTTITVNKSEVYSSGTSMPVSLQVYRNEKDGIDSYDDARIIVHLEQPKISSVTISSDNSGQSVSNGAILTFSAIAVFENSQRTANVSEHCNWKVPDGWNDVNSNSITIPDVVDGTYLINCDISQGMAEYNFADDVERIFTSTIEVQNELMLADICTSDVGHFDGEACWILGGINAGKGESCSLTCSNIGLSCLDGSWNDSGTICQSLVQNEGMNADAGGAFGKSYAPVWVLNESISPATNECKSRDTTLPVGVAEVSCSAKTEDQYTKRICKCVSQ